MGYILSVMKRLLISAAAAAVLVTGLVLGLHSMRNLDPLLEANVEALTNGEGGSSTTTWKWSGSFRTCRATVGICGSSVSGKGTLTGMHRCN